MPHDVEVPQPPPKRVTGARSSQEEPTVQSQSRSSITKGTRNARLVAEETSQVAEESDTFFPESVIDSHS